MIWIGAITLAALILYIGTAVMVARARGRHGIKPPATTGHPEFERALRVQSNTLEQLVPFLAALWLTAVFWAPLPAAILGIVWLFARVVYAAGYYRAAEKRMAGFVLGILALVLLFIGAGYGLVRMALVLG
jgi:glutathione S-transferase